jgi:hypothetical protein
LFADALLVRVSSTALNFKKEAMTLQEQLRLNDKTYDRNDEEMNVEDDSEPTSQ